MKNAVKVLAFMSTLLVFACQKEDVTVTDELSNAIDELAVSGTGTGGLGGDTISPGGHHGFGCLGGGRFRHPQNLRGDSIDFSGLPSAAQTYLVSNTDTTGIVRIIKITLPDSTVRYVVRFNNRMHLHFDAAGTLITPPTHNHVFTEITFSGLPTAAQTYLTANADTALITNIISITKPDGTVLYGVRLSNNQKYLFDASGALVTDDHRGRGRRRRH